MDVERGRTVKGWRPRRLGKHILPMVGSEGCALGGFILTSFCIFCCFLSSVSHSPAAAHVFSPSPAHRFSSSRVVCICLLILGYPVQAEALA